jgi:hypothetical protein
MMRPVLIVRATMDVLNALRRGGVRATADPPPSTTALGDWYATLVRTRHATFVLAIAEKTCLPIVVSGRDLRAFPQRIADTLVDLLDELGVPLDVATRERAAMSDGLRFARTNSRSHLGVLNTLEQSLRIALDEEPSLDLLEASRWLAETPIIARDLFPDIATCELFGVPRPDHVRSVH